MKRLKNFLLFIPLLITISACDNSNSGSTSGSNNDTNNKVNFITGDLTTNSLIELKSQEQLDTLRDNEYDFIVYAYVQGCSTCISFETKLQKYIENYGVTIYKINYTSTLSDTDPIKLAKGAAPAIGFYKGGKKLYISAYNSSTRDQFTNDDSFNNMMNKYVSLPNALFIEPLDLDIKKNMKETMTVLFTRSSCGDCNFLFDDFFNEYLATHKSKKIYMIECDKKGIRYDENGEFNSMQWQEFKDKYQLSKKSSEKYGYETGVVPTFQYFKEGILSDSDIYVNDSYESKLIEGTKKYKITITNSFLADLIGKTFEFDATNISDEDLDKVIYIAVRDFVKETHIKALTNFLNKY